MGQIKHDIGKFIGCHNQAKRTKPSSTSAADIIVLAKILFKLKNSKGYNFAFEHCWVLVRDFPHWIDGWSIMWHVTPSKRRTSPSSFDQGSSSHDTSSVVVKNAEDRNAVLRERPSGSKAAKAVHKAEKVHDLVAFR